MPLSPQGFAAGCSNGSVSIFEREADSRLFRRVWQAMVEGLNPAIASMLLTPSEEALFFTTAGHQMLKRKLTGSPQVQSLNIGGITAIPAVLSPDDQHCLCNLSSSIASMGPHEVNLL